MTARGASLLAIILVWVMLAAVPASAQSPTGLRVQEIARFDFPWALAILPDGDLLVTERPGRMFVVTPTGTKTIIAHVPTVFTGGQNGLLDVVASPNFDVDRRIYFTFMEPGDGGSGLALARAGLLRSGRQAQLTDINILWRQMPKGNGGHPGGILAFDPAGRHLFLTVGDRQRLTPAQDPDQSLGKVLRMMPDGTVPPDNPGAGQDGVRPLIWSRGHRNPYGLAFAPDGTLWLHEMGPRGGDELNRIEPGRNYGWPLVSEGDHYDGAPIPRHATRPDLTAPVLSWTPVIAPAGMVFYTGALFPAWQGSALIGGLASQALIRVGFSGNGQAYEAERWPMGSRIRDVTMAADGSLWLIEDDAPGRLLRLTPNP